MAPAARRAAAATEYIDPATIGGRITWSHDAVYIDTVHGTAGTTGTLGTPLVPSSNLVDAFTIAATVKLRTFRLRGVATLGQAAEDWRFIGDGPATLNMAGFTLTRTHLERLTLTGDAGGSVLYGDQLLLANLSDVSGTFRESRITGTLALSSTAQTVLSQCIAVPAPNAPVIDLGSSTANLQLQGFSGAVILTNLATVGQSVEVNLASGHLTLAASCTAGVVTVRGTGVLVDNSGAGCTVNSDGLVTGRTVKDVLDLATLAL